MTSKTVGELLTDLEAIKDIQDHIQVMVIHTLRHNLKL